MDLQTFKNQLAIVCSLTNLAQRRPTLQPARSPFLLLATRRRPAQRMKPAAASCRSLAEMLRFCSRTISSTLDGRRLNESGASTHLRGADFLKRLLLADVSWRLERLRSALGFCDFARPAESCRNFLQDCGLNCKKVACMQPPTSRLFRAERRRATYR